MKTIIALVALVASTSAFAAVGDTTQYNCYELRAKINKNGVLPLTVDGSKNYVRFVQDPSLGNYCSSDEEAVSDFFPTADFENCPLYTCVDRGDD